MGGKEIQGVIEIYAVLPFLSNLNLFKYLNNTKCLIYSLECTIWHIYEM